MNNPFETGHIKNYILLYVSVVVIMILFFIAATLFRDSEIIETKVFSKETSKTEDVEKKEKRIEEDTKKTNLKLLEKNSDAYIQYNKN